MPTTQYITVFISTGGVLQCEEGQSPLHSLEQAAVHYASAIRLSGTDARLHFLLGVVLEEQHRATLMYRLQKKVGGAAEWKHMINLFVFTASLQLRANRRLSPSPLGRQRQR